MKQLTLLVGLTSVLLGSVASAHEACANGHIQARLGAFSEGSASLPLYWAVEDSGSATVTLFILDANCDGSPSSVSWTVEDQTTTTAADYTFPPTPFQWANTIGHSPTETQTITITANDLPLADAGLETATVRLTGGNNVSLVPPTSAAFAIIDDDNPTPGFGLVDGAYEEAEGADIAQVPVFRGGQINGDAQVSYSIAGGSASPGSDYDAPGTGTLTFSGSDRLEIIQIPIIDDSAREPAETLTVSISGVGVQQPSNVTLTIADNEERVSPSSRLHHPINGKRYRSADYRIREIHVFTEDNPGGSGVVAADLAIRRNLDGGKCTWWAGKKFRPGPCDQYRWKRMRQYETDFFYLSVPELAPTTGKVKDYTAYSRAIDAAGNVELFFNKARNANTFELKKGN